jgi:hypothetical protein
MEAGEVATCGVIDLQLYACVTHTSFLARVVAVRWAASGGFPPTTAICAPRWRPNRGLLGQALDGGCWPSLTVAAMALRHDAPVLHYGPCFDRIAKVTGQLVEWVVPAGDLS